MFSIIGQNRTVFKDFFDTSSVNLFSCLGLCVNVRCEEVKCFKLEDEHSAVDFPHK